MEIPPTHSTILSGVAQNLRIKHSRKAVIPWNLVKVFTCKRFRLYGRAHHMDRNMGPLIARDRMLQVMPNVTLALHLLNERYNPKSFWKPYIDILPASFSLPLWFNRAQLELLSGSPCLFDALQHIRSVAKLYAHLHKLLRVHGDTSFYLYSVGFYYEDFVWAVSAVMSRQNEIPRERGWEGEGEEKQSKLALIPLWDMCNHWLGTITTDFNMELKTCDCFSPSNIKAGKELRIFYGARTNAELFLHQGFVYPPNTGDTLRIKLGLSSGEDSATKSMKSRLLKKLDIPLSGVFHILAAEDPFTAQLKAFVRVFTAKLEDLERYEGLSDEALKTELLADKWGEGDIGALQFLFQRCELLLRSYRSTLFEDLEKVAEVKQNTGTHQAVMLTICERCILSSATKMAATQKLLLERGQADPETTRAGEEEGDISTDTDAASGEGETANFRDSKRESDGSFSAGEVEPEREKKALESRKMDIEDLREERENGVSIVAELVRERVGESEQVAGECVREVGREDGEKGVDHDSTTENEKALGEEECVTENVTRRADRGEGKNGTQEEGTGASGEEHGENEREQCTEIAAEDRIGREEGDISIPNGERDSHPQEEPEQLTAAANKEVSSSENG